MYGIIERKTLFGDKKYEVVKSKVSVLGGMGYITVAIFTDKCAAERYKEEQESLAEQKRVEYESIPKQDKPIIRISRPDWDRRVADYYNDWNRAHGYR